MKKATRCLCLLLAGMMAFAFTACEKEASSPAVITCGDTIITLDDLNTELDYYVQYYGVDTSDESGLNAVSYTHLFCF